MTKYKLEGHTFFIKKYPIVYTIQEVQGDKVHVQPGRLMISLTTLIKSVKDDSLVFVDPEFNALIKNEPKAVVVPAKPVNYFNFDDL